MVGKMKALGVLYQGVLLTVCMTMLAISSVSADPYRPLADTKTYSVSNAQQAARKVKGEVGGKVLKVQRTKVNGGPGYKVKVLKDNGHVISVKVDAKSGKVKGN